MRYTSINSKLPKSVHDRVKAVLALNPQSPYESVLEAWGNAPPGVHNPIEEVVRKCRLSEIEMALALDCSMHEAAALRVIGHELSKREALVIVAILLDLAVVTVETLKERNRWRHGSYLDEALRVVFEAHTLPGYRYVGNGTWVRVKNVA